ncbi:hypothetical protein SKAU_G00285030 [Synaphobranchus kaupii]|uniref:Uncharacterized protein n=1 Tax=Synaphobranchus kaupii TaxID=118154 RepID=A0A9Q1EXT6_SYNKA|nr:hypothetical protein SKAU_G00285030 [Synaphobranchus kaupii]
MRRREEEEEMRREEEEERRRREEEQEMRWRQEKEEERKREEERRREEEDEIKRKEKEQEMRREEEEKMMRRREEEQEMRQKEEEEEKMRREEDEELKRREKEQEMRRQKEEEEEMRREEEAMMMRREKEQELRRKKEEEEEKMRREEEDELKRGEKEQEMRQKEEEEEEMRREEEVMMRREKEQELRRQKEEEDEMRREEEAMMMRREKEQELRRKKEEEEEKMRREEEEELKKGEKEQEMSRQKEEEEMRRWREEEHELQRKREEEQEMKREEQELEKKRLEEARKEEMLRHQKEREAELKAEEVASLGNPFTTEASSSNPFTEATCSNPFEESPHSASASHVSRSARISAVKPRSVMSLQTGTDKRMKPPPCHPSPPGTDTSPPRFCPRPTGAPKSRYQGGTEGYPAVTDTEKKRRAPLPPPTSRFLPALPTQSQPCPPREPMPTPRDPPVASARVRKGAAPPKPLSTASTFDSGAGERQESSEAWGGASNSRDGLRQLDNRPNDGSPANHGQGGSDRRLWSAVGPEEKANEMMTVRETYSRPLAPKTPFDDDDDDDDEALNVKRSGGAVLVHGDPSSPSGGHIGNNHVSRVGSLEGGSGQVFPTGEQQAEPVTGAVLPPDPPASATPNHSRQDDPFEGGQRREETVTGWEMTTESQKKRKNRAPLPPGAPHEDCASRDGDPVVIPPPVQCTPPPSEPQRSKVAGRRRAPQPASGAVSGGRSLLQAWVSPPEPQSITEGQSGEGGGAPGKVVGPPTAPRSQSEQGYPHPDPGDFHSNQSSL